MRGTILGAILVLGLIVLSASARAEDQAFSFKGKVLSIALDTNRIRVNETWLRITNETEILDLQRSPAAVTVLKIGDRVRVLAEHKKDHDEALQIIQVPQKKP